MSIVPLIVLGAGGHSIVLLDELQKNRRHVLGVLDPKLAVGTVVLDSKGVLANEISSEFFNRRIRSLQKSPGSRFTKPGNTGIGFDLNK